MASTESIMGQETRSKYRDNPLLKSRTYPNKSIALPINCYKVLTQWKRYKSKLMASSFVNRYKYTVTKASLTYQSARCISSYLPDSLSGSFPYPISPQYSLCVKLMTLTEILHPPLSKLTSHASSLLIKNQLWSRLIPFWRGSWNIIQLASYKYRTANKFKKSTWILTTVKLQYWLGNLRYKEEWQIF